MRYFLKQTTPSKKGVYLQIYKSFYIPGKGGRNASFQKLGYVSDLMKNGIKDPFAYGKKLVEELNQKESKSVPKIDDLPKTFNVGYFLLSSMFQLLNIDNDLHLMTKSKKFQYDFPSFLKDMVYAQSICPGSKYKLYEKVIPFLYGERSYSYDQILDGIKYIGSDYQKYIELLNAHIQNNFSRKTDTVFFDCTNYYFEIDAEDELRRKGPSKEMRKSPIIGQALMLDSDQIPLAMTLYPGNESEKPRLREHVEDIKSRYGVNSRVVQVADKGLNCAKNIYAAVREANDGYIFSKSVHGKNLSSQEKEWLLMENENNVWTEVLNKDGSLHYRYKEQIDKFTYCFVDDEGNKQTFTVKEKRVVTYNQNLALKQRKEILKEVNKAKSISVKGLAKEEYGDCAKYVTFNAVSKEGKHTKITATINQKKVDEDLKYAGYNLLVTSEIKKDAKEIYSIYHGLWRIEESFRILKTYLESRPVYVSTMEAIYGHFLICYYALTLVRLLEIKVFQDEIPASKIYEFMREYNVTQSADGTYINNATNSFTYKRIKEKLGLLKLGNLYLKKKDIKNLLDGIDLNTTN